jgi:hypothetical protein
MRTSDINPNQKVEIEKARNKEIISSKVEVKVKNLCQYCKENNNNLHNCNLMHLFILYILFIFGEFLPA